VQNRFNFLSSYSSSNHFSYLTFHLTLITFVIWHEEANTRPRNSRHWFLYSQVSRIVHYSVLLCVVTCRYRPCSKYVSRPNSTKKCLQYSFWIGRDDLIGSVTSKEYVRKLRTRELDKFYFSRKCKWMIEKGWDKRTM